MDVTPRDIPADDLQAAIQLAQDDLAKACDARPIRKDPLRLILAALSGVLGVFGRSTTRWERAVADVIAARDPLPEADRAALKAELTEAVENGAYNGMRAEAQRMVRRLDRRLAVMIGLSVGGAYVFGAVSVVAILFVTNQGPFSPGAAWRDLAQANPDPRGAIASAEIKTDRATGRRYYSALSLWLDPSRPPPTVQ